MKEFGRRLVGRKGPEEGNVTSLRRPHGAQCPHCKKGEGPGAETGSQSWRTLNVRLGFSPEGRGESPMEDPGEGYSHIGILEPPLLCWWRRTVAARLKADSGW